MQGIEGEDGMAMENESEYNIRNVFNTQKKFKKFMKIGKFRNSGWLIMLKLWAIVVLIILGVIGIIYQVENFNTLESLKAEYKLV